jgi:hypothetical protein
MIEKGSYEIARIVLAKNTNSHIYGYINKLVDYIPYTTPIIYTGGVYT